MPVVQVNSWTAEMASAKHLTTCIHTVDATKHICTARSTAGLCFFFAGWKWKWLIGWTSTSPVQMENLFTQQNVQCLQYYSHSELFAIWTNQRYDWQLLHACIHWWKGLNRCLVRPSLTGIVDSCHALWVATGFSSFYIKYKSTCSYLRQQETTVNKHNHYGYIIISNDYRSP